LQREQGKIVLDIARADESNTGAPEKVILVIPGTTSDSHQPYVVDLVHQAVARGYSLVVLNPTVPKTTNEEGLEVVDYTKSEPYDHILDKTKELFGEDVKLYAVGFSAGASNLLRHLGQSAMEGKKHGV
jgi:predicted alpha/beta-fold hydrolase